MASMQSDGHAVVLSGADVGGDGGHLVHNCEDCACEVSSTSVRRAPRQPAPGENDDVWVSGRNVVEIPVDDAYSTLFNPLGHGGAVVVDAAARRIFRGFADPVTVPAARAALDAATRAEFHSVVNRLHALEMIEPADSPVRPDFSGSDRGEMLTAWLHVTNDCNLRCPYCYLAKTREPMDEATGRAAIDAVVASAVRHGFPAVKMKYAGGEATLNADLVVTLHAYAKEVAGRNGLDLHATVLTNGVMVPPRLAAALAGEDIKVMISLDGVGASHDVQRPSTAGKPSFRMVERTIARLAQLGVAPHLSITITSRNADGVADAVRFALDRDLTFSLNFFRDNECASGFDDLRYEEQQMIAALRAAFAVIEDRLPPWSVLGTVLDRGQLLQPRQHSCGVGRDYVVVDQHGRVAKCHMEIERTLGDVFRDDPLELVRSDTRTVLNLAVEEKEGCRDCSWRYWCSGGCSVATFRATGRFDVKSPNCHIYQAIYPEVLRLEGLRLLKYARPS
ncbi:hypothetical protein Acsp01_80410 [Actinoplanes sp. NBRC 101535]|nr:hypothetical protein Acsp01_80410 [Actinoplanes sp. NBRC 101535]